ncbi:major facilitator superfamily-domain-containing protein [Xylaria intraflava]|nr:major facilitator superfamily-domain-containing protein [Xylaria intraflava]
MADTGEKRDSTMTDAASDPSANHQPNAIIDDVQADRDSEKAGAGDNAAIKTDTPPRTAHGITWLLIVSSILMANFLFATDNTVAATIQPAVVRTFNSLDKLAWLGVAFLASSWSTAFFWGDIYARFSSKWTFCSGFIVFAIGCAVAGSAPTMNALIVGRAICGVGGSGMYFGSMAILTQMTTEKERALYVNLVGITFGAGTVLGPIIGGAFAGSGATWRWAFYFNLLVGVICAPVYLFLLPTLNPRPNQSAFSRVKEIDFVGLILIIGLVVSIVLAISFGGVVYPWNSGQIIAPFAVAFALLWVFLAQQHWAIGTAPERRMFPMHFLKSSTMIVLFLEVACCATCVFVPVYFLPLYFQFVRSDSPILAGVRMLPFVAFQTAIGIISGFVVGKTGQYVPWYIFAGALCIPGAALLYTVNESTPLANIYGYEILIGLGSGAATQLTFAVASLKVAPEDIGRSTGWEAFAQLGGPAIALGIANSIFLNKAHAAIAALLPSFTVDQVSTIISDPNSQLLRTLSKDTQDRVVHAVVRSMSDAYILCILAGALVFLLIFRFKINDKLWG